MSAWRRVALDHLSEYKRLIAEARNPMSLWIDLEFEFESIYSKTKQGSSLDDDLVGRFYKYANWRLGTAETAQRPTEISSAVTCAFFEHIILIEKIREDMHRWLSPRHLEILSGSFTYHYPAADFLTFKERFLDKFKRIKPNRASFGN
jgi:hypothetical protein